MTTMLLSFVLLATTAAVPQQSGAAAAKAPADNAPSLEATMKIIQDGILGQQTYAGEYRAAQADAGNCTLSWTTVDTYDKKTLFTQHTEQKVSFPDIAKLAVTYDEVAADWNLELYAARERKFPSIHTFTKKMFTPANIVKR